MGKVIDKITKNSNDTEPSESEVLSLIGVVHSAQMRQVNSQQVIEALRTIENDLTPGNDKYNKLFKYDDNPERKISQQFMYVRRIINGLKKQQ